MGLLVDLYELVMADSYLRQGMNQPATFDLFIRQLPPHRSFLISAGLEAAQFYLEQLRFDDDAIAYLGSLNLFSRTFLEYLREFRFAGDVRAIREGEIFFPPEPLMEVTAPRIEAQIVETFLLNAMNFQTMIASKTARIVLAARGGGIVDFSPRRDHGTDAAMKAARASYIAGCIGTSNVLAGKEYGIHVYGTIAHSYIMSFSDELSAFRAYARDFPHNAILLIDTYDTMQGAAHAVTVAREMAGRGQKLRGVRIDSGDHAVLSRQVRAMLNDAELRDVQIFHTGELDEYKIERILNAGGAADSFGVGTELGTSGDAPSLGGVYKLVEDERGPRVKLSTGKATLPGRKQVWRTRSESGFHDVIALEDEPPIPGAEGLLVPVLTNGAASHQEDLVEMRARCLQRLKTLPPSYKDLYRQPESPVTLSPKLEALRKEMYEQAARIERG